VCHVCGVCHVCRVCRVIIRFGNTPGKQATIRITYVTELGLERSGGRGAAKEAPRLKFSLPSRLAPKYAKKNAQGYHTNDTHTHTHMTHTTHTHTHTNDTHTHTHD
jgi:hypothetical protein